MAEDWYADVIKYAPDADPGVVAAIVRHCGIALQNRDSSLVAFTSEEELGRVRESFLKKKLGLTDPDSVLNEAIAAVGQIMKADRTKNRVTVYYLLAHHFGKLGLFGATAAATTAGVAGAAALGAGVAAGVAGLGAAAANADSRPMAPAPDIGARAFAGTPIPPPATKSGFMRLLPWLILAAVLLALWYFLAHRPAATPPAASAESAAPATASTPVEAAAPASAPTVADAAATEGLPAKVYFEVGAAAVSTDGAKAIAAAAEAIKKDALKVSITGYTDTTGDMAKNQELAKNRAKAVRDALTAAGVPVASIEMKPPLSVETGAAGASDAEARRVEISKS